MKIETLNDSNYHSWKIRIQHVLALKDLEEFLEEDPPTETAALPPWQKKDKKARAVIGLTLSKRHARECTRIQVCERNVDCD